MHKNDNLDWDICHLTSSLLVFYYLHFLGASYRSATT